MWGEGVGRRGKGPWQEHSVCGQIEDLGSLLTSFQVILGNSMFIVVRLQINRIEKIRVFSTGICNELTSFLRIWNGAVCLVCENREHSLCSVVQMRNFTRETPVETPGWLLGTHMRIT